MIVRPLAAPRRLSLPYTAAYRTDVTTAWPEHDVDATEAPFERSARIGGVTFNYEIRRPA